jgi:3-hydroxyanthranilate 3,4-dioxygenase
MCLVPALTPHIPHRPADTWGLVIEVKRTGAQTEGFLWLCAKCDARLHEVMLHVADIEKGLRDILQAFDASVDLRTCKRCGHVQPDRAPAP